MASRYDHGEIEKKWQERWEKEGVFKASDAPGRDKEYLLVEFPYPSGNLHVGHWYAFSVPDILARYWRMRDKDVLYPIGFDAFGLPAENAAIKRGLNPRIWTFDNIDHMRAQLKSMGASFDWSREVITCNPEYYRWTQWMFTEFFKKNLAYRAEREVNWCPTDKTVLANEQVVDGRCERCDAEVEKRQMLQWNLKITDYADRLVDDLEPLEWPEQIKESQRNWIGRSEGAEIPFQVISQTGAEITVFTTRPDTLFGATYMVLAPEHPLVEQFDISNRDEVGAYVKRARTKSDIERTAEGKEKTGVELQGIKAINPATKEEIPVFIADYVLAHYGTGAIMAVPAHDERDYAFAKQFNLPIREVIGGGKTDDSAYTGEGMLTNSGEYDGLSSKEAKKKITEAFGRPKKTYRLRDWVVSRQRYWGVPIPIIHCTKCGEVPVPEKDLPVLLPEIDDYLPSGEGKSPLAKVREWVETACPLCGGAAERETDTLDTFVDSSWYFLRYLDPKNSEQFAGKDKQNAWMPIDLYSGGAEHTTMHLLYSRFWHKVLFDLGLVGETEPYTRRMNRSLIMGPDGQKMSKSRGNVIDPDEEVSRVGSDAVRMYLAFMGPYNEVNAYPWNKEGTASMHRFLERAWRLVEEKERGAEVPESNIGLLMQETIKGVGDDIEKLKFNTAISKLMILLNAFEKETAVSPEHLETFVRLLSPFAPHLAEELWNILQKGEEMVCTSSWPAFDAQTLSSKALSIAVQVNGKTRAVIEAGAESSKEELIRAAKAEPAVAKWLEGKEIAREVIVPGRLINFVLTKE